MSADLWADFVASVEQTPVTRPTTIHNDLHNDLHNVEQHDIHDHEHEIDDFGDFQDARQSIDRPVSRSKPMRHSTEGVSRTTKSAVLEDVLFDAEDPDESLEIIAQRHAAPLDLIDLDDNLLVPTSTSKPSATSRPASFLAQTALPPAPAEPAVSEDDWDDFETTTTPATISRPAAEPQIQLPAHMTSFMTAPIPRPAPQPPLGIPPPSLLLTLFPSLITSASQTLQQISALPAGSKALFISDPNTHAFLVAYHDLATVLAHVLAGRKTRWKRDKHLAQSMSIGNAAGRGMKLAGLDKTESAREDVAASDAVSAWRAQSGRLKSVVSATALPLVIEVAETMPVRVAKGAQGGVVGLYACGVCGLKREERVGRVDEGVEDMFDVWWVESARCHATCWRYWEGMKEELRSR